MSNQTQTQFSTEEPTIVMTRIYDAPRALVWERSPIRHVKNWWGGPAAKTASARWTCAPAAAGSI